MSSYFHALSRWAGEEAVYTNKQEMLDWNQKKLLNGWNRLDIEYERLYREQGLSGQQAEDEAVQNPGDAI